MNNLARAIELTEEIRASLEAEIAMAREERVLIRRMDSDGMNARAAKRAEFNTRTAGLMVSLGHTLGAAASELGLTEVTMDALQTVAPLEGGKIARLLAAVRALAKTLSDLDALNRALTQRALSYVRAHLAVLSPKPAAYDRRGSGATTEPDLYLRAGGLTMADLFALLVQSGNSLGAQSAAMSVAGNNVANANTPGYSRQIANLAANPGVSALGAGSVGTGASLVNITQARDQFVERQIPNALAAQSRSQTESDALSALTALNPDLPGGLPTVLGAFYSSLQTWSQNPGDLSLRQNVMGNAQALATSFNQAASSIAASRSGLDAAISGKITEVNAAAKSLADLNKQIQIAKSAGGQPNDLIDARQTAVDHLATLTGATPYTDAAGDVSMALPGGTALVVNGSAGQFSAIPDPANGGYLKLQLTRADGFPPSDWNGSSLGGTLGGMFGARDGALKTAADSVDGLAFDMATALNNVQLAGYDKNGNPGIAMFILPATSVGAGAQITVNAQLAPAELAAGQTTPTASGDNSNILAMINTQSQALPGGSSPVGTVQNIVTTFGTSAAQAQALAEHDGTMASNLQNLRDATSGVSIDEEMVNLTKAQKAYEAISKVISTANQMLETLLSIGS